MHTVNRLSMAAPPEAVFALARDVTEWPNILAHYRYVRELNTGNVEGVLATRTVVMCAERSGFPVRWTASQRLHQESGRIEYDHIAGITRGMHVVWNINPTVTGVDVTIEHDLRPSRIWLRGRLAAYVVGTVFVEHIADLTLAGIKLQAEHRA